MVGKATRSGKGGVLEYLESKESEEYWKGRESKEYRE